MAIMMFGCKLSVPTPQDSRAVEKIVDNCAKKTNERRILLSFIRPLTSELLQRVYSTEVTHEQIEQTNRESVIDFYLSELKARHNSHFSVYDDLVLKLISQRGNLAIQKYISNLRLGKSANMPTNFPSHRKYADSLVVGKLRSDIGENEVEEYIHRRGLAREIKQISQDMFYAVNNKLDTEQSIRFMGIMFELRKIGTANPTNELQIKTNIVSSIRDGRELKIVHIKCGRYVYPHGREIQLLEHSNDAEIVTKSGSIHRPRREFHLYERLERVRNIFETYGVSTQMLYLLSEQDIDDYFPDGSCLVSADSLKQAKVSLNKYEQYLRNLVVRGQVVGIKPYLEKCGKLDEFIERRKTTLLDLSSGKGVYPESFVESRVDYRFESNKNIFTVDPGRKIARDQIYAVLASLQALGVLSSENLILVEDDRGDENQYIGGYRHTALPVYFTRLREKLM